MIHFILSTYSESKSIIDYYRLKQITEVNSFKLFVDKEKSISLTISGIGKLAASVAVTFTNSYFKKKNCIWINIGIAGHISEEIGKFFLIHKIVDSSSKKNWYPSIVFKHNFKTKECKTLCEPSFKYNEQIYDMELSGFYFAATKFSHSELVHSIKIISDNKISKINFKDKDKIKFIIKKNLNSIEQLKNKLKYIRNHCDFDEHESKEFGFMIKKNYYTKYQKNELKKKLKIYNHNKDNLNLNEFENFKNARETLLFLKKKIRKQNYD